MEFGIFNLMSYRQHPDGVPGVLKDMRHMVGLAEEIGFDTAWFAEHHFTNYSISVSPLMFAAHMAGQTSRIKLGTAVVVLPLYQPLRVAQEIALVDQMSEGRLVLGLGSGYQPFEFARLDADVDHRSETFLRYWDILEEALSTGNIAAREGLPETPMLLRPVSGKLPELFIVSTNPEILSRLCKRGATPFITTGWRGSKPLIETAAKTRAMWDAVGLPGPMPLGVQQYIHVTDSKEEALIAAECARFVGRMGTGLRGREIPRKGPMIDAPPLPDEPPLETIRDNIIIGPAEYVAERVIAEIEAMSPTHYNCFFQFGDMPLAMASRALTRFGAEVMPVIRRHLAARAEPQAKERS